MKLSFSYYRLVVLLLVCPLLAMDCPESFDMEDSTLGFIRLFSCKQTLLSDTIHCQALIPSLPKGEYRITFKLINTYRRHFYQMNFYKEHSPSIFGLREEKLNELTTRITQQEFINFIHNDQKYVSWESKND